MKRLAVLLVVFIVAGLPVLAQTTVYVSPDVPTNPGIGIDILPWQAVRYDSGVYGPLLPELSVPGNPAVDALHKMDKAGFWLFSLEEPSDLGGLLPVVAEPRDVIQDQVVGYNLFFCGAAVTGAVPISSNIDAIYLVGTDTGDLVVSFDVPTTIGAQTYDPADLVRYKRTGASCAGWTLTGLQFDASAAGAGIPTSSNLIGADEASGIFVLSFDIPTDLNPSMVAPTFVPGQIASWNGVTYNQWDWLSNWPLSSLVDALTCQGNPGKVYDQWVYNFPIDMDRGAVVGTVIIRWAQSCSSGAEDYGIYEGTLGSWYSHKQVTCTDLLGDLQETITTQAADSYYLVVPHNYRDEGAFGVDHDYSRVPLRLERPQAANLVDRCTATQILTPCP